MRIKPWSIAFMLIAVIVTPAFAYKKDKKDKKKEAKPEAKLIDSGSFGVFVNGERVATETFNIKQMDTGSITTSDIKVEGNNQGQHAELQLSSVGTLIRYDWKETGSEKGQSDVVPSDQFIVQHIKAGDKYTEQPYLMPVSTAILDDYFFSQRELLLWRYLGSGCVQKPDQKGCPLEPAKYGFVIPRQRTSGMATISYIGKEAVMLHGTAKELNKFSLSSDFGDWLLYLDENNKLVRVLVPGEATEVIRDLP
ncbi:MAG TPA: hypothetical protein VFU86_08030 [Terriglobales bacterium]|nr:hypothetical protein [Terriglobales bacterium]